MSSVKVKLIGDEGDFNTDHIINAMPDDEFNDDEIHNLVYGFVNIPYIHLKTGHKYFLTNIAIECTNGQEDKLKCIYRNEHGIMFSREFNEFFVKFKREV